MAKRTITVTEQIEIDIEFPLYVRIDKYSVLHILSEKANGILVSNWDTVGFKIYFITTIPDVWLNSPIITKEEFESEFKKVQDKINQLI